MSILKRPSTMAGKGKPPLSSEGGVRPQARTLQEMAKLAGVSAATVSRALAGNELIALKTRTRVQALAKQVGFTVNPAARMLRTRQSRTIALILPIGHEKGQHLSDPLAERAQALIPLAHPNFRDGLARQFRNGRARAR
ncbi:LacI family DNA-binding transcriptional regulator [Sphingobium sp. AN558]|uniref:LacI family DNA-binding transcriptional regulator n=1 Tax=Sphingobium sp. AN558 TaxID=3133442 RepID=UPI0030C5FB14